MNTDNNIQSKIHGCLIGQAYGDAFGMPSELWTQNKVREYFCWIDEFLDGPAENIAANEFHRGQFTDDTQQSLAMLDAIFEAQGVIEPQRIARHLLAWARRVDAFNKNILGPTSKHTLVEIDKGVALDEIVSNGVTNGAAMRVSPIGCLLRPNNQDAFIYDVRQSCIATHQSDIAIAGAVAIAWCVAKAVDGASWQEIKSRLSSIVRHAQTQYESTFSPLLSARIDYAFQQIATIRNQYPFGCDDYKRAMVTTVYQNIGAGMDIIESIPAALALVDAANTHPLLCAELAANLGGDTDTIGAMGCAICGAINGVEAFPTEDIKLIESSNNTQFSHYVMNILQYR